MIRCILYPGAKLFVSAGGKEQSAGIMQEKVEELCTLIPAFKREIDWRRGKGTQTGKDYCKYQYKNGSWMDNLSATEKSRGKRRHAGILEECTGIDGKMLNEVLIPVMNIDRPCADGNPYRGDTLNKAQLYITTAGYKNTFSYDKLIQLLIRMITDPDKAFIMGGTYRIPVLAGLQDADYIEELRKDGSYNEASFGREFESTWTGTVEGAFFNGEWFDKNRKILMPELERSGRLTNNGYYVLGVDVGRRGDQTEITVVKVHPQVQGYPIQSLVNIVSLEDTIFEEQARIIRKMYDDYRPRCIIIDGNGLGTGLVDMLVRPQYVVETGDLLPSFGVINDNEYDYEYKKFRTDETIDDVLYIYKGNVPKNSDMHSNLLNQMRHSRIKFLIDENVAKGKLLATQVGKKMTPEQRGARLRPYNLTTVLKLQLLNLVQENEGTNIILKQSNRGVKKDKVSSLEMALYWVMLEEGSKTKKKHYRFSDMMFLS